MNPLCDLFLFVTERQELPRRHFQVHHFRLNTSSTCAVHCQMYFPVNEWKRILGNVRASIQSLLNAKIGHIASLNEATTRDKSYSALGTRLGHNERLVILPLPATPSVPEKLQPSDLPTSVADAPLVYCFHWDGWEILMPPHNA